MCWILFDSHVELLLDVTVSKLSQLRAKPLRGWEVWVRGPLCMDSCPNSEVQSFKALTFQLSNKEPPHF